MEKNYDIDDILSEIKDRKRRKKQQRITQEEPSPPDPPPKEDLPPKEDRSFSFDFPLESEPPADDRAETDFHFKSVPAPPKRRQNPMDFDGPVRPITDKARIRSSRRKQPHEQPPEEFSFQPVETGPPTAVPPIPPADPLENNDSHGHTQVIPPFPSFGDSVADDFAVPKHKVRPYAKVEDRKPRKPAPAPMQDGHFAPEEYYTDEFGYDDIPDRSSVDFSEYNSVSDRRDVATDIARVKLWLFIRGAITFVLTFLLFWLSLSGRYTWLPLPPAIFPEADTMRAFLITCTTCTALLAFVNSSAVGGGLISLFKFRANSDTLAALAILAALAQGVMGIVGPENINPTALNLYFPIAGLAMLFGVLGKLSMINRIQTNFRLLSSSAPKKALMRVENERFCREVLPSSTRKPTIAYAVSADFFTDFLGLSYSDKYDVGINRSVAPVCLIGSLVVAVVSYLLTRDTLSAVSAFTAVLCVSATLSAGFIENIPLGKLTKKLAPMGGMVSGNKAVEDFCDTAAVVFTEKDLFPPGHVQLRGIQSFSQGRIDESILDAASVICSLDGALSPVFLEMIGGDKTMLKPVDSVVYENDMGVSAWVASRRVLVGNRRLMETHGVQLPPQALQASAQLSPEDGEMLYVSNSGELTAQFAVSYHINDELAIQLDLLAGQGIEMVLYTNDANITPARIWELYGFPEELVHILPAEFHAAHQEMTEKRKNAIAEIVYTGRASTFAASIIACINARSSILSATLVLLIQVTLGYGLVAFMAFMGVIASLSVYQMLIYQLFWFVIIFIVQQIKQP